MDANWQLNFAAWLHRAQCCQMVYFQTKNPNLDNFWRVFFAALWYTLEIFWYILWKFGIFSTIRRKSGNPDRVAGLA
jgi:hypothetical protein